MNKTEKTLAYIEHSHKILEIGPSLNPIAPRSAGWNSFSLDHASKEDLKKKYEGQGDVSKIEEVDFVWRSGPIEGAIPSDQHGTFDAIIASHVIEHTPDLVGFLRSCMKLLRTDGVLSLVIPDRRYTFDFFKGSSTIREVLDAHQARRTRHSIGTAFTFSSYNVLNQYQMCWGPESNIREFRIITPFNVSKQLYESYFAEATGEYVDYHCWYFTPASFRLLLYDLNCLGLIEFNTLAELPPYGMEFYVSMQQRNARLPSDETIQLQRINLMRQVLLDEKQILDKLPFQDPT